MPSSRLPRRMTLSSPQEGDMSTNARPSCLHRTLDAIDVNMENLSAVPKADLKFGDLIVVTTAHSTYSIYVLEDGLYSVSGGWFDRQGLSPVETGISGCTWGGSAIKADIVAARGLHLEFGNRVVTSRIRNVQVRRCTAERAN